jgi:hypothetical protein
VRASEGSGELAGHFTPLETFEEVQIAVVLALTQIGERCLDAGKSFVAGHLRPQFFQL